MMTLLEIGSIFFWILIIISSTTILYYIELEDECPQSKVIVTSVITILTLALIYFFGGREDLNDLFSFIKNNPLFSIFIFLVYSLIGAIWSIIKWYLFVLDKKYEYQRKVLDTKLESEERNKNLKTYIKNVKDGSINVKNKDNAIKTNELEIEESENRLNKQLNTLKNLYKPSVEDNKPLIIVWMMYWPISSFWAVINNLTREIFNNLYRWLEGVYNSITNKAFSE